MNIDSLYEYIEKFNGLSVNDAYEFAKMSELRIRVVRQDGESFFVESDFRTDRVNVEVKDGMIIKVIGLG